MRGTLPFLAGTPIGHYRMSVQTGLMAAVAAGATIFSMRWGNTSFVRPLITRIRLQSAVITPYTGAQEVTLAASIARAWSAADSAGGGAAVTLTGLTNVQNSLSDVPSAATAFIAGAGAVTAGTRTVDANPILICPGAQGVAAAASATNFVEIAMESDAYFPWNLQCAQGGAANAEGIVVLNSVLQGAGGTTKAVIDIEWIEYNYQSNVGVIG
jgi:hypothetical protein